MSVYVSKYNILMELVSLAYRCKKVDELQTMIINGISRLIDYESAAFFLVNPENWQYKEPFFRGLDPSWFEKYSDHYEKIDIYKDTVFASGIPPVDRSSDYLNYREWENNEHRADFLLPQGIYHLACLQVTDGNILVGEISLHRGKNQPDFSNEDMNALKFLQEHLSNAFLNLKLICQRDYLLELVKNVHLHDNSGYILMDRNFKIVKWSKKASLILETGEVGDKILCHIKEAYQSLWDKKVEGIYPGLRKTGRVSCRYGNIAFQTNVVSDNDEVFIITVLEDIPGMAEVGLGLSKYNVTRREAEIAHHITQGKTNDQICSQLFISENTLKTHLKQLYIKLSVKSRNELTFKILSSKL